ncbi:hypothetical protein N9901_01215 [Flavobacteriaceae bacterium]|nr:hypothetical protein [Flavobacteriaceae bacterium]
MKLPKIFSFLNKNESKNEMNKTIHSIIILLEMYDENSWVESFKKSQFSIENNEFLAIYNLKKIYGGMGSFNDLVICKMNKHKIEEEDETTVNNELDFLRKTLYQQLRKH